MRHRENKAHLDLEPVARRAVDQEHSAYSDRYRIAVCLLETGARYAQVRRMRVGDVKVSAGRLMVPVFYIGRGGNSGSDPVPVGDVRCFYPQSPVAKRCTSFRAIDPGTGADKYGLKEV